MTQRMALYLQDKHDIRYELEIAKYAEEKGATASAASAFAV